MATLNQKSPIILFTYNRISQVKLVLESLQDNYYSKQSDLFIYSDGAKKNNADIKKVSKVRNYLRKIKGFKKIPLSKEIKTMDYQKI